MQTAHGFRPVNPQVRFPELEERILEHWRKINAFSQSLASRQGAPEYIFYEGPPTANGKPGVHHVQARAYKDLFPRYKTMRGFLVQRKAGWDCHGLPVEIEVEKQLGFSGKKAIEDYGIEPFNKKCRESVMTYEGAWREMTERIGFWVDLDHAYMTMSNEFVESVWWSLKTLWDKDLIYLGYKVVPYCAHDSTPLSSHEVGLGYKDVKDPSITVRFPIDSDWVPAGTKMLVWTTTPWTLPGNTGCAVHPEFKYVVVKKDDELLLLAESLREKVVGDAEIVATLNGSDLVGAPYEAPFRFFEFGEKKGHRVVAGDFVTAEDGTGIVHIAPAFGADDLEMARKFDLPVVHSVGIDGKFVEKTGPFAGMWFKDADKAVIKDLKERGLLFKREEYLHSYPHCWRCSSPLMYYATDSWFIANTRLKDELIAKNQEINWVPAHIKNGRYGDWLNNLVDWALSRTRYWGTPLPIWTCVCGHKEMIGSFAELASRSKTPLATPFDPHRPYVDDIELHCKCGGSMKRVPDVIDCWYDSGAMPFAQLHYPFENKERFEQQAFPADFICEGLDQTRGWFNSLHQLGVMLFGNIAYKNVICHGLILDGQGEKMSKRLGNIVDPWTILNQHGADSLRWYLYTSAPPEQMRRFSADLVGEACRKFMVTLWNTYHFYVSNSNANTVDRSRARPPAERSVLDRWLLAALNELVQNVSDRLDAYDVTGAARAIASFVDLLSNWYVRRSRDRFWDGEPDANATLHEALVTVSQLLAPFTPFLAEDIYLNLDGSCESVHLTNWPVVNTELLNADLVYDTEVAIRAVSAGRSARVQNALRIRQPLSLALVGASTARDRKALESFREVIQEELNVKELRFLEPGASFLDYQLRPNLPLMGKKYGKQIPLIKAALDKADPKEIARQVHEGQFVHLGEIQVLSEEILVEVRSPEGYAAQEVSGVIVALSTELTPELLLEGTARDLIRTIQELRKQSKLAITDRIKVWITGADEAVAAHKATIMEQTLAVSIEGGVPPNEAAVTEIEDLKVRVGVLKA